MNPAELRDQCLSFPGSEETFPFGPKTSVFKVAGKMFALSQLGADSLRVSLKCEPQLAEALRGAHAAVLPGYHLNKRHWNTVIIDGSLPDDAIRDMIGKPYQSSFNRRPPAWKRLRIVPTGLRRMRG
jgi:predicted DNA-binding protein (MmcQ/YjbR family)